jgi:F0F1-type ATP synthase assembly protein I
VQGLPDPQEMRHYFVLGQIGLEMVVPVLAGLAVEYYVGGRPWGVIAGAALGLIGGFLHLIVLLNRQHDEASSRPRRDSR